METCIVIAKLIGILNSHPVDLYKLDCSDTEYLVIIQNDKFKEVKIENINHKDLTYNIRLKGINERAN